MNELTTLYVEVVRYDPHLVGTLGDVERLGRRGLHRCLITTDVPAEVIAALDSDDNVISYEVCQGDEADQHRQA